MIIFQLSLSFHINPLYHKTTLSAERYIRKIRHNINPLGLQLWCLHYPTSRNVNFMRNVDPVLCRHRASLGHHEFNSTQLLEKFEAMRIRRKVIGIEKKVRYLHHLHFHLLYVVHTWYFIIPNWCIESISLLDTSSFFRTHWSLQYTCNQFD